MSKHYKKIKIRLAILAAAHKSGIKHANQFGNLCKTLGISKSLGVDYYIGKHDMTGAKLDLLLNHFKLRIK